MGDVSKIAIKPSNVSWKGVDVGYTEGAISIKMTEKTKDITAQQTGETIIGNVRTGNEVEVTLELKESDIAKLKKYVEASGGTHTPTGGTPTALSGWGTSRLGTGTFADAGRLVIHGVNAVDHTEDFTAWKAYPLLGELKYSGNDFQTIPLTFKCYIDPTKPAAISHVAWGDSTQASLADA